MKKLVSLLLALMLVSALAAPAFAEGEAPVFDASFHLVNNEPSVVYDEWDIPCNVWDAIPDNTPIHSGDTVTMALTYTVPEEVEGYDARLAGSLEFVTEINGVSGLSLVEAQGCPPKLNCDYDIGICYPVPGEYANVELDGNTLTVMAELGSEVCVVVRGTADSDTVTGSTDVTIGQYRFPAQFSLCTVDKAEANGFPSYNAHWSDFNLVQKRAVEFRSFDGGVYDKFVALNNHYFRMAVGDEGIEDFVPVDDDFFDSGDPIAHDDDRFAILSDIFENVKDFFGLDYGQTEFSDETFIGDGEHYTFSYPFEFGGEDVGPADPTEEPAEPTEEPAPAEPTAEPAPAEPTPEPGAPEVPGTGTVSLAILGILAITAGAGIVVSRKK
ncbi:MAG: hypothetical protein II072_09570 [Clostridia bacterium]|nr:hypothetical protein [Clostridia bacterium]MBQ2110366.1 hypothetical protein [Clostridia bacterium]MBQ2192135.1 hypothetical protein [Clostridia bacterium]